MRTMIPRREHGVQNGNHQDAGETKAERLDRELEQLMHEVRSILPGVQIQGAFLLTVAFTNRFETLSDIDLTVYYVTFLLAAAALILLLAPSSFHRVQFRNRDKEAMMRAANVEVIAALVLFSFSIAGTVFLITDLVLSDTMAIVAGAITWLGASLLWWAFPLTRRVERD